jgi:hypothetical protein
MGGERERTGTAATTIEKKRRESHLRDIGRMVREEEEERASLFVSADMGRACVCKIPQ